MPARSTPKLQLDMLAPGTMLGRYELIERLAVGGMAELYLARASGIQGFEKLVALKRILPQYADKDEFVTMFLDEARLAATLQHPNIAQVYDIGQTRHGLFFTMEYVHGRDVRDLLRRCHERGEPLGLEQAITIGAATAAALHAAHEQRGAHGQLLEIVHRDVSPANILVSFDGCVKLIDFGVAKAAGGESETRAGTLKGKIAYMAPEQCLGDRIDRRTDVFALGIVLYELTCNRRLFSGDNEFATMKRIVGEDVAPPSALCPGYPPELEEIVLQALARNPADRHQSAEQLQLELEGFARSQGMALSSVALGRTMREQLADEGWRRRALPLVAEASASRRAGSQSGETIDFVAEFESGATPIQTRMFEVPDGGRTASTSLSAIDRPVAVEPEPAEPPSAEPGGLGWLPAAGVIALAMSLGVAFAIVRTSSLSSARAAEPAPAALPSTPAPLDPPVQLPQAVPAEEVVPEPARHSPEPGPVRAVPAAAHAEPGESSARERRARKRAARSSPASKPAAVPSATPSSPPEKEWNPDSALPP